MIWENLKKNKCPKCNKDWLVMGNARFENKAITCKCGFKISELLMSKIVTDRVNRDILEQYQVEEKDEL